MVMKVVVLMKVVVMVVMLGGDEGGGADEGGGDGDDDDGDDDGELLNMVGMVVMVMISNDFNIFSTSSSGLTAKHEMSSLSYIVKYLRVVTNIMIDKIRFCCAHFAHLRDCLCNFPTLDIQDLNFLTTTTKHNLLAG